MAIFCKPENALKRADELIKVGQKEDALQTLHGLITSKSYRFWQKLHEKIMFRYLEICVELRRGRFAKDGLIQYRNACQQVNVNSLEEVIKHLVHLATEKAEQALDVDDLEADRSDREQVTQFLWETYRTVLEILRNNSKLEALYAMTAHKAFHFCKQYKRPREFSRVCEIVRNHLSNLDKYRDLRACLSRDRPDLTAPETLQLYLHTRFEQLKVATELQLWQEAFRSVEDIYGLMCMVKKTPKPSLLIVYYSKLTEIFWMSSSILYHAYAWLKLFSLQKTFNNNLSQKDLQLIASSVVLAALSVPPFASHLELENEKEGNLRMANLIRFNLEPKFEGSDMLSRASLMSELVSRGVLSCASQEVQDLYNILELEFHPLDLGSTIKPLLDRICKLDSKLSSACSLPEVKLSQYVPSLEKLATLRLLHQVSRIYQTVRINYLAQLVPFFDFSAVEKISIDAVKNNFVAMKVDHVKGVVIFGNLGSESDPLTIFADTMNKVRAMLFPAPSKPSKLDDIGETVEKENKRLLARKAIIERKKEEQERHQLEMDLEEEKSRLKLLRLTEEVEQKRLATELEERRRQRILKETEEMDLEEAHALLQKRKEVEEAEKKLQKLVKTMDYLERAKQEEAVPLIEAAYQQRLVEEREFYEREQEREVELSRERHESNLIEKKRLARSSDNKVIFQERVISIRQAEFERLRIEKEERIGRARKQERDSKRKQIYYLNSQEERITKLQETQAPSKYVPLFRR